MESCNVVFANCIGVFGASFSLSEENTALIILPRISDGTRSSARTKTKRWREWIKHRNISSLKLIHANAPKNNTYSTPHTTAVHQKTIRLWVYVCWSSGDIPGRGDRRADSSSCGASSSDTVSHLLEPELHCGHGHTERSRQVFSRLDARNGNGRVDKLCGHKQACGKTVCVEFLLVVG